MSGHRATVDLGPYGPSFEYACDEPEGADCRMTGGPDCYCERWTIERDAAGVFHNVIDEFGDFVARHDMHDDGECNIQHWLEESDSPFGDYTRISLRITPKWDGDFYLVEDFEIEGKVQ